MGLQSSQGDQEACRGLAVVQDMALVVDVALADLAQVGAHLAGHLLLDLADLEPVGAGGAGPCFASCQPSKPNTSGCDGVTVGTENFHEISLDSGTR